MNRKRFLEFKKWLEDNSVKVEPVNYGAVKFSIIQDRNNFDVSCPFTEKTMNMTASYRNR